MCISPLHNISARMTSPCVASAAILTLILWFAMPHHEYYTAVATILGKLYSNSLLAIFNSRSKFAGNHNWKTDPLYLTYQPDRRMEKAERTIPVLLMPLRKRMAQSPEGIHVSKEVCVISESDRKVSEGTEVCDKFCIDRRLIEILDRM